MFHTFVTRTAVLLTIAGWSAPREVIEVNSLPRIFGGDPLVADNITRKALSRVRSFLAQAVEFGYFVEVGPDVWLTQDGREWAVKYFEQEGAIFR